MKFVRAEEVFNKINISPFYAAIKVSEDDYNNLDNDNMLINTDNGQQFLVQKANEEKFFVLLIPEKKAVIRPIKSEQDFALIK